MLQSAHESDESTAFSKLQAYLSMNARYEKGSLGGMGSNTGTRIKQVRTLAGLSQEKFAEVVSARTGAKVTRGAVGNWELGGGISRANLTAISDEFNVDLNWLERGTGIEPTVSNFRQKVPKTGTISSSNTVTDKLTSTSETLAHNARIAGPALVAARVPIRGRGMGGRQGALLFDDSEFLEETGAHPKVVGVTDAFAVYVIGDSMLERFKHGELVYVHPYAPYVAGDDVLIQVQAGEGQPVYGYVKRFLSETPKVLKVQQLNPKRVLTFPRQTVLKIQKIVGSGSV